jgi:hypothetical protein
VRFLAEVGVPPRRGMYLLGRTDPMLTMRVYQQVLDMGGGAVQAFGRVLGSSVLGCSIHEALATNSGRGSLRTQWAPGPEIHVEHRSQQGREDTV